MVIRDESCLVFDTLGPLEVRRESAVVPLGPPQRRLLLLRLIVAGGESVQLDRLIDDIWNGDPPGNAESSVYAHVSRLRQALGPGIVVRTRFGYAATIAPDSLASVRFTRAVQRAGELLRCRRVPQARQEIDRALARWRGAPLADAADAAFAHRAAALLVEERVAATELRVRILLAAGEHTAAIGAAKAIVADWPLRESATDLLMRALYRDGRAAEALAHFERLRAALADQYGILPSPELRGTHLAILRQQPSRPATHRAGLVGRERETALLREVLGTARRGTVSWALLSGAPGTGKTALAEWLGEHAERNGWQVAHTRPTVRHGCTSAEMRRHLGVPGGATTEEIGRAIGRGPVLWIVEDLQWLGDEGRDFLVRLAVHLRNAGLAVVCTVRDPDAAPVDELTAQLTRRGAYRAGIEPLNARHVGHLLALDGGPAPGDGVSAEAAELHRRTGGNPLLLRELLTLPPNRRCGPHAQIPAGARSALRMLLRELPEDVRDVLAAAAPAGPVIDERLVASAGGGTGVRADALMAPAVRAGLVRRRRVPAGRRVEYRFAMALAHEALAHDPSLIL